ncbi:MAG: LD-carboxypeptidase [Bdellovibrionia bacterium]
MGILLNLKKNHNISVIAPGYPVSPQDFQGGIAYLQNHRMKPLFPEDIIGDHFLHAQDDEKRLEFLKEALFTGESEVVWAMRGGYGSNRLLPGLAKLKKPRHKKLVIGISDITSLHVFLHQEWNWPTWHGPLLDRCGKGHYPEDLEQELWLLLQKKKKQVKFQGLMPLNASAESLKKIESKVVGGNLTVLQSTLGTPWQIQARNKILFIEDLGERGYRIDRMLEQMRQARVFNGCKALLIGHFLGGAEPSTGKDNFDQVFARWAADLKLPVFKNLEAGHDHRQRVLPLNTKAVLSKSKNDFHLIVESGLK